MTRVTFAGGAVATVLSLLGLVACKQTGDRGSDSAAITSSATPPRTAHQDFIYGRVTTDDDGIYEGRLRFGGDEEALWGNYFYGVKRGNPWAADVPRELLKERVPIEIFGLEVGHRKREIDLSRPFMARFGDIARIDARGRELRVTLKSGAVVDLDRFSADDFADGVRVWDASRGVVDLDEWRIRTLEFLSTAPLDAAPDRLFGTVRTSHGDFAGFVQWDREQCLDADVLTGQSDEGELSLPFRAIRSIERHSSESALVTLRDGRTILLSGTREVGNRGIYVDDQRYGRVLISWDAFERVDFTAGGAGPAYGDFTPGRPITGSVVTRSGRRLAGRLVYDLDESETTETLDAPSQGIDYTIPFSFVAAIVLPRPDERAPQHAKVILHSGEELQLERSGDFSERNAGMLVFFDRRQSPEYVPWADVARIDFDRPPETRPRNGDR